MDTLSVPIPSPGPPLGRVKNRAKGGEGGRNYYQIRQLGSGPILLKTKNKGGEGKKRRKQISVSLFYSDRTDFRANKRFITETMAAA